MKAKILPVLLFAPLVLFLIISSSSNIAVFIWSWGRPTFFSFIYSCVFLLFWLLLLFFAVKKSSKGLLKLHLIFWLLGFLFAIAMPLLSATPLAAGMLLVSFVFIVPLVGLAYPLIILLDMPEIAFWDITTVSIVSVSLIMFLLGFSVKRKLTK